MSKGKPSCYEFDRVVQISEAVAAGARAWCRIWSPADFLSPTKKTAMPAGIEVARASADSGAPPLNK
jgi:hypothetical protein